MDTFQKHVKAARKTRVYSTRRLEALTDGVFAIAMTLLVLDLKATDIGHVNSSADLVNGLLHHMPGFPSFVISFLLLGSMWAVHSRQFEYINRTDRHLTMINTVRLLVVVLIPLTTSIAGSYQSYALGRALLPLNFLALAIVSYWEWSYAVNPKSELVDTKDESKAALEVSNLRNQAIIYLAILVVIASLFVGEIAFVLIAFSSRVEKFLFYRKYPKSSRQQYTSD